MNKIKESNLIIKSYFRDIIQIKIYSEANNKFILFRSNILKNNYKINKIINNYDMILFILLPIIYKFGNSNMNITNNICNNTRNILFEYLIHDNNYEFFNESLDIYLNSMRNFEKLDKKNLYINLFTNYYELLELNRYIEIDNTNIIFNNIILNSINYLKKMLFKFINLLGITNELQTYLILNNNKYNIFNILDNIYWDHFEKLLKEFNYELLNLIIIDLNKLFLDIITLKKTKNINLDIITNLLNLLYTEILVKYNLFNRDKIKNLAKDIFLILKKLDSKEFEILYEKLNYELDYNLDDNYKFVSLIIKNIYFMLFYLKNKIEIINFIKIQ